MKQLTIVSGSGINMGISDACPNAESLIDISYQKISRAVYDRLDSNIKSMFTEDSFDYILGGLLTINLTIEKTKEDVKRFNMNEEAFLQFFQQSSFQESIADVLDSISQSLTTSTSQIINVADCFSESVDSLFRKYDSINYYTVNFDGIFDHILYGRNYSRGREVTDFWNNHGLTKTMSRKVKIFHLHGDLRYKPFKKTAQNSPPYKWPVLVVGDNDIKKGIISSNDSLLFFKQKFDQTFKERENVFSENNLAIIGFGFREEDDHIKSKILNALSSSIFDNVFCYDQQDKLMNCGVAYTWIAPSQMKLTEFFGLI